MSTKPPQKNTRSSIKRTWRKTQARLYWGNPNALHTPVVFGNAMPKSGSHLLLQILQGFVKIGPFLEVGGEPVRTITLDGRKRSQAEITADLEALEPGDLALGYLWATPENITSLSHPGWTSYFILRDPRDMLISHLHYATDMYPGHGMHAYYNQLPDMDARLAVAIQGIDEDGARLAGVAERYARWFDFLEQPKVLALHFEDLISDRAVQLPKMLDHLEASGYILPISRDEATHHLEAAINPSKSPTFRKGRSGEWRTHFSDENKALFKEATGDLLVRLGYERDQDW